MLFSNTLVYLSFTPLPFLVRQFLASLESKFKPENLVAQAVPPERLALLSGLYFPLVAFTKF